MREQDRINMSVDKALNSVNRKDFVTEAHLDYAELDVPLQIGYGQTISQPIVVRRMLEWLDPKQGDRVLDVGSGSGWTSALIGFLIGSGGHVHAVERIPELVAFGRVNLGKTDINNVSFHQSTGELGWQDKSPYDRILVSAAAKQIPEQLLDQLRSGGKMVIPVDNDIIEIQKTKDGRINQRVHHGYVFVPLITTD